MVWIIDGFNGRISRNSNSIYYRIYAELMKTGQFSFDGGDKILLGTCHGTNLGLYAHPVYIDIADNEDFITTENDKHLNRGVIKKIFTRNATMALYNFVRGRAEIIHIPPPIPEIQIKEKDIDASFICSIDHDWKWHQKRIEIYRILHKYQEKNTDKVLFIGNVYDDLYSEMLGRTKLFIVEPSMRPVLTNKYWCGIGAGCKLVGTVPITPKYIADMIRPHMIEVYDWNKLPDIIEYTEYEEEKEFRAEMLDRFSIEKIAKMYYDNLDLNGM